jgi:hypothetical protein
VAVHTVSCLRPAVDGKGGREPEHAGGEQRPELDQRIKITSAHKLDYHDIPPRTCEKLLHWPPGEIDVLVKVYTELGISLEHDPPLDEGEGLESGKPTTPLKKYQFVVH